jgi:hypothetical protein
LWQHPIWQHPIVAAVVAGVLLGALGFLWHRFTTEGPSNPPATVGVTGTSAASVPAPSSTTSLPTGSTTPPSTPSPTVPPPPVDDVKYLSEFGSGLAGVAKVGSSSIGGTDYLNSVTIKCLYGGDRLAPVDYQLGGRYATLSARVGIDDATNQPGAVGTVTVTSVVGTSRRQLKTVQATKDTTTPIRLDVSGVRTLEFACSPNEGHQGFFNVVLGNAVLHR